MQRNQLIAIAAALIIAVITLFAWQHVTRLGQQLTDLSQQVDDLGGQVVVAKERATAAETRAEQAERASAEAAQSAESAAEREQQSAAQAREEAAARAAAEERERLAQLAHRQAEERAEIAALARQQAEEQQNLAEIRQAEERLKAEAAHQEAQQARAETEKVQEQLKAELDRLQTALGRIADTRRTALGLVMTLDSSQIEFDFNKATLRPENREVLSRIAGVLLTSRDFGVQVFGHTDDVGSAEYNQQLSERRAAAVRDYLVEAGIEPAALSTMGLGKTSPLVEGSDPTARQRNRRVELAIVFSEGDFEVVAEDQPDPVLD